MFYSKVKRGKEVSANVGYSLSQEKRYPLVYGPHCRADSQKRKGTALKRKLTKANRQLFSAHHQTVHEEVLEHGVSRGNVFFLLRKSCTFSGVSILYSSRSGRSRKDTALFLFGQKDP